MQGLLNILIVALVFLVFGSMVAVGIIADKQREKEARKKHPIFYHMKDEVERGR